MYSLLFFLLLFTGCRVTCIEFLATEDQFKNFDLENQEAFNEIIDDLKSEESLIIFIEDNNCLYLNWPTQKQSLEATVYDFLKESGNNRIALLTREEIYDNEFELVENVFVAIKNAYTKIWEERSVMYFNKRSLSELTSKQKSQLQKNFPSKLEIRLDHISEQRGKEIYDKITSELPPINPFILEGFNKGLK